MRHQSREYALQALYLLEIHKTSNVEIVETFLKHVRLEQKNHFLNQPSPEQSFLALEEGEDLLNYNVFIADVNSINEEYFSKKLDEMLFFSQNLAMETSIRRKKIDRIIKRNLENWKLGRLSVLLRNILRLAVYEMYFAPNYLSHRVIISESLELTEDFVNDQAKGFVNSVLQKIHDHNKRYDPDHLSSSHFPPSVSVSVEQETEMLSADSTKISELKASPYQS